MTTPPDQISYSTAAQAASDVWNNYVIKLADGTQVTLMDYLLHIDKSHLLIRQELARIVTKLGA